MKLKVVSVMVVLVALVALSAVPMYAQVPDASVIWLTAYGKAPAVSNMKFGTRVGNTFGPDTAASFPVAEYKEQEAPPPSPGFDCIWAKIRPSQWSIRGLLDRDYRAWAIPTQKDTFKVAFVQADSTGQDILLKWPGAAYLAAHCSAAQLKYTHDVDGPVIIDMFTQDSVLIVAAGDNNCLNATIIITGPVLVETGVILKDPGIPASFGLNQNYPNPFNPTTTITFDIQKLSAADISVYNVLGQKVATLFASELPPGTYSVVWNGTTDNGLPVSSGMYFARMNARVEGTGESYTALRKLLLMK